MYIRKVPTIVNLAKFNNFSQNNIIKTFVLKFENQYGMD